MCYVILGYQCCQKMPLTLSYFISNNTTSTDIKWTEQFKYRYIKRRCRGCNNSRFPV
ncbi:hypothetical protein LGKMAHEF_01426 [Aeromonas salmonicida]